jgi:hypothetical protein
MNWVNRRPGTPSRGRRTNPKRDPNHGVFPSTRRAGFTIFRRSTCTLFRMRMRGARRPAATANLGQLRSTLHLSGGYGWTGGYIGPIYQFTDRLCAIMIARRLYCYATYVRFRYDQNKTDELRIRLWQIPNSSVYGPRLPVFRVQSSQCRPLTIPRVKPYFISPLNQLPAICLFARPAPDTTCLFSVPTPITVNRLQVIRLTSQLYGN